VRLLPLGRRFAALRRFVAVRRFAAGRRLALVRRFPVVRRFEVAPRFPEVRRFEVARRFTGVRFFRVERVVAARFLRFAIRCLIGGASLYHPSQRGTQGRRKPEPYQWHAFSLSRGTGTGTICERCASSS
jgi:hypothetical protein